MIDPQKPDEKRSVAVDGYKVVTYSYGKGDEVVFLLNGGPGLPCDYLRDPLVALVETGYRVVTYDQLGTGQSDTPTDPALWTIGRYCDEVDTVRKALGIGRMHLLGHSWGGWLGIEYALKYPAALKSLVLSNTSADMPHMIAELDRLRGNLGAETQAMMLAYEAEGNYDHPEYKAAITLLSYRHVYRLRELPPSVRNSIDHENHAIYDAMQGPNEFHFTGNLKDWNRVPDLPRIKTPTLVLVGLHDELTPACAMRIHRNLPNSEIRVFRNSSHMAMYEEPQAYLDTVRGFLDRHRG
ncbi:MAG: proline iminopeptidase-family hydrolase [Dongiaceae bacterium]